MRFSKLLSFTIIFLLSLSALAQQSKNQADIDKQVQAFLESKKDEWRYWNVPYQDGKVLYDIIIKNKYTSGLEIGTSTGHSTIWMAWAMSKTGGKIITVEIDEGSPKTESCPAIVMLGVPSL